MNEYQEAGDNPRIYLDPRLSSYVAPEPPKFDPTASQEMVDKWLLEKNKFQISQSSYLPRKKFTNEMTINSAKKCLKQCLDLLDRLERTQEELRINVETMTTTEWKRKTLEIGTLRDEFNKYMVAFENNNNLSSLRYQLNKRKRKRAGQHRARETRREIRKSNQERHKDSHKSIDDWLECKKEEVERVRMEEKMKRDADCVMYEVTKKKSEARKHLSLISAIVKLRNVRDTMATQRGEKTSLDDRRAFGSVTEKLIRMWENACQDYSKEEQCLKLMLDHNASKDCEAARIAREQSTVGEWERIVFGPKVVRMHPIHWALSEAERDLEKFIAIRKSWDTFVTSPSNESGSSIPIGWVMPPQEASAPWTNYLET